MKKILTFFFVVFCFQIAKADPDYGALIFPFFWISYIICALIGYLYLLFSNNKKINWFGYLHFFASIFYFIYTIWCLTKFFKFNSNDGFWSIITFLIYILLMSYYYRKMYLRFKNSK